MMRPKFVSVIVLSGFWNCAWLKALKSSVRNCSFTDSPMATSLPMPMSQLLVPGPGDDIGPGIAEVVRGWHCETRGI